MSSEVSSDFHERYPQHFEHICSWISYSRLSCLELLISRRCDDGKGMRAMR